MLEMYAKPFIKGLTTNPTLMRKAGITDYKAFRQDILQAIPDRPISFEVFSDEFRRDGAAGAGDRELGARTSMSRSPSRTPSGQPSYKLIEKLAQEKVKLNVTALMTLDQVRDVVGRARSECAELCFGVRRPCRRYRPRSAAD